MNKKILEFQKQKCSKCLNRDTELCEIIISRIDGQAACKYLDEEITVFRFMSKKEFNDYKNGEILKNDTIHKGRTNSIGFCFLNVNDYTPEKALHFLSGIVSFDICAIFKTTRKLRNTYGIYASPMEGTGNFMEDFIKIIEGFSDKFTANEYCTTHYSNKDFRLVKYSENLWQQWNPSKKQSNLRYKNDIKKMEL